MSVFLRDAYRQASAPHICTSFLRVAGEDSVVAKHYAQYAHKAFWIEYTGEKHRNDCIKMIDQCNEFVNRVSFSPDGTRIDSLSDFYAFRILDAASGNVIIGPFWRDETHELSVAFSPDGRYIISGSEDGRTAKWDAASGEIV